MDSNAAMGCGGHQAMTAPKRPARRRKGREVWLYSYDGRVGVCSCGQPESHRPPSKLFREVLPRPRKKRT